MDECTIGISLTEHGNSVVVFRNCPGSLTIPEGGVVHSIDLLILDHHYYH